MRARMHLHIIYPRGDETYIYRFVQSERRDVLTAIGRQCLRPELSLDWRDAARLEQRIAAICEEDEPGEASVPQNEKTPAKSPVKSPAKVPAWSAPNPPTWFNVLASILVLALGLYMCVGLVKLCNWLAQFTWP